MSKYFVPGKFPFFPVLLAFLAALSLTFSGAVAGDKPDFAGKPEWKDNKDSVQKSDRSRKDEAQRHAEDRGNKKGEDKEKKDKKDKPGKPDKMDKPGKPDKMDKKGKK